MEIKKKPYLIVLGGGESGIWSAILASINGYEVLLSDIAQIPQTTLDLCQRYGISYESGEHCLYRLSEATDVIKSPGIPDSSEVVQRCVSAGVPVISEIEFASRYTKDSLLIGVTGSNGKTTTTALTAHLLKSAGIDAVACGNIGISLAQKVVSEPHACYVIELSSFQLDHMYDFRADIALLTNITPDHLDRYEHKLELYADAKGRIFANQRATDLAIYCAEDPLTVDMLHRHPRLSATVATFGLSTSLDSPATAYCDDNQLIWNWCDKKICIPYTDLPLQGPHNRLNMLAAGIVAISLGASRTQLSEGLRSFSPIEHRLEPCGVVGGVRFINDSKATNIDATLHALQSMPSHRVVLLLGGTDKGNNYEEIFAEVKRTSKALVYITKDSHKLHATFDRLGIPSVDVMSFAEAFDFVDTLGLVEGDVVLLSPACASFDLFRNYEDRGRRFKEEVRKHIPKD